MGSIRVDSCQQDKEFIAANAGDQILFTSENLSEQ